MTTLLQRHYQKGGRAPLAVLPTGAGKTVVFAWIAKQAAAKGNRVMILVHRDFLLDQTSEKLAAMGVPHGIIAPDYPQTDDLVQVASVHTVVRRFHRLREPVLIIIDEAHHAPAGQWTKVIQFYRYAKILGVTATPDRMDGTVLGFDGLYVGATVKQLTADGWLVPARVYAPPIVADLAGLHMARSGDYQRAEIEDRLDRATVTGDAVQHYLKYAPGLSGVAFCCSVEHARHVAATFTNAGVPAQHIDGSMTKLERKRIMRAFAQGGIKLLTSCELISEGFDLPEVAVAILLRPTESLGLYLQQVGRALRPSPGKQAAIILDHVGNCIKHGLPDDEREWNMDGRKKRKTQGALPVVTCEKCFRAHHPTRGRVCPYCQHVPEVQTRDASPIEIDGELEEVTATQLQHIDRRWMIGRAQTLEDLYIVAHRLGYKPAWARYIWNARAKKRGA